MDFKDEIIFQNEKFIINQDWECPIPGFFIISTKDTSIRSFMDFDKEMGYELMDLIRKLRQIMTEDLGIEDVYFFQNEDTEHGFHLWVFPRLPWMEKFGRKIQSVRPIYNHAKENMFDKKTVRKVREWCKIARQCFNKRN